MADPLDWLRGMLGGGDPEAAAAAQNSMAMQPAVLDHLQNVLSDTAGRLQSTYDPSRSFRQNALDPAAIEQATNVALGIGPGAIRAFHGSPHSFSRFDMSKVGTGEGAQAYGHGLYFAEAEDVARRYRESLAGFPIQSLIGPGGETLATGRPVQFADKISLQNVMPPDMPFLGASIKRLWTEGREINVPSVIKEAWGGLELPENVRPKITAAVEDAIERSRPVLGQYRIETTRPGSLYEVNINAEPRQFLDWDKSFLDQPQAVQDTLRAHVAKLQETGQPMMSGYVRDMNRGTLPGGGVYMGMGRGTPESASAAWNEAGIPGIRYLDQGSRGGGQGTSNYVVFDDKLIDIIRKYGIVPPVAGGAAVSLGFGSEPGAY